MLTKIALPSYQHYLNPFMIKLQRKSVNLSQNRFAGKSFSHG